MDAITSGILFAISAQVSLTVSGLLITNVVSGLPYIVHSFLSNSSLLYTLPIHSASMMIPSLVSNVVIALMPVAFPFLISIFRVSLWISSSLVVYNGIRDVCIKDEGYKWFEVYPDDDTIMFDNHHNLIEWYFDMAKK